MSDADKIKKILTDRIAREDDSLEKTKEWVELAPSIQRQKEEDEISLQLINELPEDVVEELAPEILAIEQENDRVIVANIPEIPHVPPYAIRALDTSASGTISPYISAASNAAITFNFDLGKRPEWVNSVTIIMDDHSKRVAQREYIPDRLNKLNHELGKKFRVALDNFNRCQNGIIAVDLSAMHLRDVIEQVWGGLVALAFKTNTDSTKNTKYLQLKKVGDRDLVTEILATPVFPKIKLVTLLKDLYDLHFELSSRGFVKDPLNKNFPLLKIYFNKWLTILDGISGLFV